MRIERISLDTPVSHASSPGTLPPREEIPWSDDPDLFQYSDRDLTQDGRVPVIIYNCDRNDLRNARRRIERSKMGSVVDRDLPLVNGFSARIDPADMERVLERLPEGSGVRINPKIQFADPTELFNIAKDTIPAGATSPGPDTSRLTINIQKAWDRGFTGKDIGIAIIDSGIHKHPDLKDKITGWVDIAEGRAEPYDNFGHGTHVAGAAAGSGAKSAGKLKGTAPDANLIGVRITTVAEAIKGLQWVIENKDKYNIRVVNMSLGDFATKSYKDDPWTQAAQKAIEAGLIVCVAAGNEGPDPGTVSTPGTSPDVITIGALDDKRTADRKDDTMALFSSRGPTSTDGLVKPDLIAPGVSVFAPLSPGSTLDVPELPHIGKDYIAISGTSMATPLVSGVAALLVQANPDLTHQDVKKILRDTADRYLPDDDNAQGNGLVDVNEALDRAIALKRSAVA